MPATKIRQMNSLMSAAIRRAVPTKVDIDALMSADHSREAWQSLIDQVLLAWLSDPSILSDDGVEVPSRTTIRLAIDYAESFRDEGKAPPDSIVPDANGGIILRRRRGGLTEVIHVWDDGSVEYQQYCGGHLAMRQHV
jgi:hypothetical protein